MISMIVAYIWFGDWSVNLLNTIVCIALSTIVNGFIRLCLFDAEPNSKCQPQHVSSCGQDN